MRKRIASIVLSVCLCLSLLPTVAFAEESTMPTLPADAPTFNGGSGTETDPYLLSSKDDIVTLQTYLNNIQDAETYAAIDCKDACGLGCYHGYYFKLTKDIDMTGVTDWTPFNFCGTLDGAGHTISNMQMNQSFFESTDPDNNENKSTEYEAGFFNQLVHAHIKNLYFVNCTATVSDNLIPESDRDIYAAIVAGTAIASSFENVSVVNCTVSQNGKPTNMGYAAGLVAYADICHISGCSVQGGNINVGGFTNDMYTGGLVGAVSDMYNVYITDYNNPFKMQVGAGKDFGIYNSFSTATISVQNATGSATGGLIGMVECCYLDFTCKNCMVGGTITASTNAAGLIGSCDTSKRQNIDTNAENCVIYSTGIQGGKYADCLYRPDGGKKDLCPVTFTNCKVSDATSVSVTDTESGSVTNYGEITPTALTDADCQVSDFKSNLHGKLTDGTQGVTIALSQNDEVKYTAVTDKDGEYNFGKQVLKGEYTLNIAESGYKADPNSVTIGYAENKTLDITRTGVTLNKSELSMTVGSTETLTATIMPDNAAVTWTSDPESVATVDENGVVTAIAAGTATITATSGAASASCTVTVQNSSASAPVYTVPTWPVTLSTGAHGSVTASATRASSGSAVVLTVEPKTGYQLDSLLIVDENGKSVAVTRREDGRYCFVMPDCGVTITTRFLAENWVNPFTDISTADWYYDAVSWACQSGVATGTSATTFSPNDSCTRAQLVTLLWRAAGEPEPASKINPFTDVAYSSYYKKAVLWAVEQGITTGTSATTFSPDTTCTRAEAVTFLFRYAAANGMDAVTLQELVSGYGDAAGVPGYSLSAFNWALATSLVQGAGGRLLPNDSCTRAQIVTMLYRLLGA